MVGKKPQGILLTSRPSETRTTTISFVAVGIQASSPTTTPRAEVAGIRPAVTSPEVHDRCEGSALAFERTEPLRS